MTSRRGFTLVETLAAAALLAVMAAACLPLIAQAARAVEEVDPPMGGEWDGIDLGALADEVAAHPDRFGIDPASPGGATVEWTEHPERPAVQVSRLEGPADAAGAWLRFDCDGRIALRWIRLEPKPTEERRP